MFSCFSKVNQIKDLPQVKHHLRGCNRHAFTLKMAARSKYDFCFGNVAIPRKRIHWCRIAYSSYTDPMWAIIIYSIMLGHIFNEFNRAKQSGILLPLSYLKLEK